ncbi:MAG TPA: helix-turn-helix transcriptional regulator [Spirochaetia bacterium]|nr:helix-turn-helix transcriptional regulator [Spirochaetia bacterium]
MHNPNITGRYVAALRKKRGVSQEDFAEGIGVTSHAVMSWESGRRAMHRAVVDRFLAITEALNCSGPEGEELYGAARADQFVSDLRQAPDHDAVYALFKTTMPGGMRNWLIAVFSQNKLLNDAGVAALKETDFAAIRQLMMGAVKEALRSDVNINELHLLLLFLARSGHTAPSELAGEICGLLEKAFERLGSPVARRDVAIALAELGHYYILRRYIDLTENDDGDKEENLQWIATIVGEPLPGPQVLRKLIEILEDYVLNGQAAPLVELTLRSVCQLLAWRGVEACDSLSAFTRLGGLVGKLVGRKAAEERIIQRASDVMRQVKKIAGDLVTTVSEYA